MDPFVEQLKHLCAAHPTRSKWVFVPTHALGRTLGDRLVLEGTNWANLRFVTPLDIALRMGAPFLVERGPIGAFTAPHDDPAIDAAIIDYVSTFVPKMSGANFNPHVSTGVAPTAYLDSMLAEPFKPFTFSPAGAAVYQLGPFGTAAKKLKEWDLRR